LRTLQEERLLRLAAISERCRNISSNTNIAMGCAPMQKYTHIKTVNSELSGAFHLIGQFLWGTVLDYFQAFSITPLTLIPLRALSSNDPYAYNPLQLHSQRCWAASIFLTSQWLRSGRRGLMPFSVHGGLQPSPFRILKSADSVASLLGLGTSLCLQKVGCGSCVCRL